MSDISQYEGRITAALDRIGNGLSQIQSGPAAPAAGAEQGELQEALEAERVANAQLEERVRAIRDKQEKIVGSLEAEVTRLRGELAARDQDSQRMEKVNAQLRANNQALREANQTGVGDPHLINKAMMAELESLRASRDADRAELDGILSEIKPLVEGAN